jgi:aspartyl-tRNA(Asn)/glutamyl-tRNA(Gln) amidotransferase subunit B
MDLQGYTITVGIECHVQLKTHTKLFAPVANDAREAAPNTLVSHICFGMPGALPVLNKEAVHLAARAAFALGTTPQPYSTFDRKHYFYPDLPLGYQITQFAEPIIIGGSIDITIDGQPKTIGITRAHIEADAGKSTHPAGKEYSLVDLNRAGTPLLEIVSEPDIHTPAEAKAYARELYLRMKYADVSDANLYYGNMRFDVNVSVSKTAEFGTRTETKNINSFRAVEKVVEYEAKRQIAELEAGGVIVQETRGWDDTQFKTISQRTKEDAHDYRYFPDPDLPPVALSDAYIAEIKAEMPRMPEEWRELLAKSGVPEAHTENLLDAQLEFNGVLLQTVANTGNDQARGKAFANWILNIEVPLRRQAITDTGKDLVIDDWIRADIFDWVFKTQQAGAMSSNQVTALITELLSQNDIPEDLFAYAKDKGYIQDSDVDAIAAVVAKVIAENQKAADDVRSGEMKAIGFLVGQVMKQSQGKANPAMAKELIAKHLQQ